MQVESHMTSKECAHAKYARANRMYQIVYNGVLKCASHVKVLMHGQIPYVQNKQPEAKASYCDIQSFV